MIRYLFVSSISSAFGSIAILSAYLDNNRAIFYVIFAYFLIVWANHMQFEHIVYNQSFEVQQ